MPNLFQRLTVRAWPRGIAIGALLLLLLAACGGGGGGGGVFFSISVTVNGLSGTGLVLRVNGVNSLPVMSDGVATFASALPTGAAYVITVAAAPATPTQVCLVTNGTGTVAANPVTNVVVTCHNVATAAYVVNLGSDTVSQFHVGVDGNLTAMTPPTVPTGLAPSGIALDPGGRFAYVSNDDGTVAQFTIGADGRLTPMVPATVLAGLNPTGVTVSPSGANAYVSNDNGTVSQYAIGADGRLSALAPATVPTGLAPSAPVIDPTGRFAYVANSDGNSVSQFNIALDGRLTPMAIPAVLAGLSPAMLSIDPTGQFVQATNFDGGTVSNYRIGVDGSLSANGAATIVGTQPVGIVHHPNGRDAYVANFGGNAIGFLQLAPGGALVSVAAPDSTFVNGPIMLAIERTGRFAYATTSSNMVVRYMIDSDGRLQAPTSTGTGVFPVGIALR